jgi:hypothetical protein
MSIKISEDDLDIATNEFVKTYKEFEIAAKNLMAIMDGMIKASDQGIHSFFEGQQQIHEFIIQMIDDKGRIGEKSIGIKCEPEKVQD